MDYDLSPCILPLVKLNRLTMELNDHVIFKNFASGCIHGECDGPVVKSDECSIWKVEYKADAKGHEFYLFHCASTCKEPAVECNRSLCVGKGAECKWRFCSSGYKSYYFIQNIDTNDCWMLPFDATPGTQVQVIPGPAPCKLVSDSDSAELSEEKLAPIKPYLWSFDVVDV